MKNPKADRIATFLIQESIQRATSRSHTQLIGDATDHLVKMLQARQTNLFRTGRESSGWPRDFIIHRWISFRKYGKRALRRLDTEDLAGMYYPFWD